MKPSNELIQLTDLCHLLFCKKWHETNMNNLSERKEEVCYYQLEETLDSCWETKDHAHWVTQTLGFLTSLNFDLNDEKKALTFLNEMLRLCGKVNELISEYPESVHLVRELVG